MDESKYNAKSPSEKEKYDALVRSYHCWIGGWFAIAVLEGNQNAIEPRIDALVCILNKKRGLFVLSGYFSHRASRSTFRK